MIVIERTFTIEYSMKTSVGVDWLLNQDIDMYVTVAFSSRFFDA